MNNRIIITCAYCKTVKLAYQRRPEPAKRYCNSTCYNRATRKWKPNIRKKKYHKEIYQNNKELTWFEDGVRNVEDSR